MAMSSALSPTQPLVPSVPRPLHAYVETIDSSEFDELYMSTSTASSPTSSSPNSLYDFSVDDEDVEEVIREGAYAFMGQDERTLTASQSSLCAALTALTKLLEVCSAALRQKTLVG